MIHRGKTIRSRRLLKIIIRLNSDPFCFLSCLRDQLAVSRPNLTKRIYYSKPAKYLCAFCFAFTSSLQESFYYLGLRHRSDSWIDNIHKFPTSLSYCSPKKKSIVLWMSRNHVSIPTRADSEAHDWPLSIKQSNFRDFLSLFRFPLLRWESINIAWWL